MADLLTPQYEIPFRLVNGEIVCVEQDTPEERFQNVKVVLMYHTGDRDEIPEFGIPDQTFRKGGADLNMLRRAVQRWEPYATVDDILSIIEDGTNTVTIELSARREEST